MRVICPNCGEKVPAEHINIQNMTAVCPNCDNVFSFVPPDDRAKRRKVRQPERLMLRDEDDTLHMEFWTNFRLDRNGDVIASLFGTISAAIMAFLLSGEGVPVLMPFVSAMIAAMCAYALCLIIVNKTHIEMDDLNIRVSRKPIPTLFNRSYDVSLAGVTAIKYEETAISKKESYDTPRYRVWAETADGARRTIVNDVTEEYAVFIAQRLEEHLHADDIDANMDAERDVSHLEDKYRVVDEAESPETVEASHNQRQQR